MPLLIASHNPGKIKEFEKLLKPIFKVVSPDGRLGEIEEGSNSYRDNALKKAKTFYEAYKIPVLSDDSGLEIDVLNGAPGVLSARFGGEQISWSDRFKYLYEKLQPFPEESWSARFRCVLCLFLGDDKPLFFEGLCEGKILKTPQGYQGFGYDPVFYSKALQKSFGIASDEEKGQVSHRALAVKSLLEWSKKNSFQLT